MKSKSMFLFLWLALLAMTTHVNAQKVDIVVAEDSWVSEDAPDQNNNGITDLECGVMNTDTLKTREVYLKFDLTSISGLVKSADLSMVSAQKNDKGWVAIGDFFIEVVGASNEWAEDTLTWNNKPEVAPGVLAEANITSYARHTIEGSGLAGYINNALLNGETSISLMVRGKNETNGSRIWISDKGWEPVRLVLDVVEMDVLSAVADSWVSEDQPDQNNNGITDLEVARLDTDTLKSREAFVKFDISNVTGYVDAAVISIMSAQKEVKDGWIELDHFYVDVYGTKPGWDETTLTWQNKPANKSEVLATIDVSGFQRYGISSDALNTYITQAIANGDQMVSFAFRGRDITNGSRIWISDKGWEPVKLQLSTFEVTNMSIIQDTWVSEDEPDANFNGQTDMQVAVMDTDTMKSREAYVQFNIKELEGYASFAALRMAAAQKSVADGYIELENFNMEVYGAANGWDETSVTWNTRPVASTTLLAEANIKNFITYEIASEGIAEYINQAITKGDTLVSFVFKGRDLTNGSRIWISDKGWIPVKLAVETIDPEVISVLEDSWVSEDAPDQNNNGITDLECAVMNTDTLKSREVYLKFDIRGIVEKQSQVVLKLVSAQKEVKDGWIELEEFNVGVYGVNNKWAEDTLTWNNKPGAGNLLTEKNITGFNHYYLSSEALTGYVNAAIAKGDTVVSLTVKGMDETNGSRIWISDKGWIPAKLILDNGIRSVVQVTGVELDITSVALDAGQTVTLTATVSPGDASDPGVSWSSDDESIATVANGVITAVAKGNAVISVTTTDGGFTASCDVTVEEAVAVTGIFLNKNSLSLEKGGSEQLVASIEPADASNQNLTWSTSSPFVALVSGGNVIAQNNGTAVITVTTEDGGFTATCDLTVGPTGISEVDAVSFEVFPNPATDHVTLRLPNDRFERVVITDLTGKQLMLFQSDHRSELKIDLQGLDAGVYIICIQDGDVSMTSKLFVE